jgi:hypothetical protein
MALLATPALALCLGAAVAGPAVASPDAGTRPAGVPLWVPQSIDHPTPAPDPLPVALTAGGTPGRAVLSPRQAGAVVSAVWNLRAQAFEADDRSLMAEFESGPALESDEVTCGCNTRSVRGPINGESLLVPRQQRFPAAFLAEVKTTLMHEPYVQYLVIARQSKATPWKVVADPGEAGTRSLDRPKLGQGGFDDAAAPHTAAKQLPKEFAAYWHTWTEDDRAPSHSPFAPGKWTTQAGATYAKDPSGSWSLQNDLMGYYGFEGGGDNEVWSFGTAAGAITCGVVRWQTIWASPGAGISQDPAQNNWGTTIAPGNYQYEAETQIMQPCFVQRPGARVAVVSGLGDPDTEQGVNPLPATPTSPVTPGSPSTPTPPIAQA